MTNFGWRLGLLLMLGFACVVPALGGCAARSAVPLWDVPSLVGQPIDVVQKTLGKPQSETTVAPGTTQSLWQHDDVSLRATWKSSNKRVLAYELISRDNSEALREGETSDLLVPGQLKENDPRYSLEWIEATDRPLFYTGVKVVPAPKNHAVVIGVRGTESLLQVAYQISSPAGKSDNLLTIAPWEATFTLPDDATVALSADLYKRINKNPIQMKVEIVVDGKVVASDASTGRGVRCNYEL